MTSEPSERRERLVRAAESLFARKGIHAATVPEIAAEAGVSAGLLYRYFPSKAALAVAIVERDRDETRQAIESLTSTHGDAWDALVALVHGWVDVALSDRSACSLVAEIGAQAARDLAIRSVVLDADEAISAEIARLISAACPDLAALPTAIAVQSALDGIVSRIAADESFDPRPAADAIVGLLEAHRKRHDEAA